MIRGAVTKGKYWQLKDNNNVLVASDALVRAVKIEKMVSVPAIVISDDLEIPEYYWAHRFAEGLLATPVLHFRDRNIINPFNQFWFASARMRASILMQESPEHEDKYLWFLALHDAVTKEHELIPSDILLKFINEGVLKKKE